MILLQHIRRYLEQPLVRPWALIAPVVTLVICLPLLRPLRQPESGQINVEEQSRLAMVESIVEQHTLRVDHTSFGDPPGAMQRESGVYASTPPMQSAIAAPVYWVLRQRGLTFKDDMVLVRYLLVLLCVTLPVALSAGMVYRLGRLFELPRPVRAGMALLVTLPTGLLTCAVVFQPIAPAAVLLLAAVTCLSHIAVSEHPRRSMGWLVVAGLCAALAATFEPSSLVLALLLPLVIVAMRWPSRRRLGGALLYVGGMLPVLALNGWMVYQMTGTVNPVPFGPLTGPELVSPVNRVPPLANAPMLARTEYDDDMPEIGPIERAWAAVSLWIGRALDSLLGQQGLLSHYPVVLVGIAGAFTALRRHWAATTKTMAAVILASGVILLAVHCVWSSGGAHAAFGPDWILVLLPIFMIWSGSWLKRPHHSQTWIVASVACAISLAVAMIGTVDRPTQDGYRGYSVAEAIHRLGSESPVSDRAPIQR